MTGGIVATLTVWLLFALKFLGFFLGAFITTLSFYAYRNSDGNTSLRNATLGFGLLTAGTAVEPAYQLVVQGSHVLASEQHVGLKVMESSLISLGFLVLFFSIYKYSSRSTRQTITISGVDDELFEGPE